MGYMSMNQLQKIEKAILNRFPDTKTTLDPAESENGSWFLDAALGDYSLVLEWHPQKGIGVTSNPTIGYGEGAEEVFLDLDRAQKRVLELLLSRTKTIPPPVNLSAIRRERKITQTQLASSMKLQQASIAKMEKRSDIHLSTLQAVISAMGGWLSIRVVFPDGMERELCFSQNMEGKKSTSRRK